MDEFQKMKKEREKLVSEYQAKYKEESKKRLQTITERKIQTAFIGAISSFEDFFGFLWSDAADIDDDQAELLAILEEAGFSKKYFEQLWQSARTNALNGGNSQIRAIRQELQQYTINWDRYRATFPVVNTNQTKEEK